MFCRLTWMVDQMGANGYGALKLGEREKDRSVVGHVCYHPYAECRDASVPLPHLGHAPQVRSLGCRLFNFHTSCNYHFFRV